MIKDKCYDVRFAAVNQIADFISKFPKLIRM
jgi:hypothetical protein